MKQNSVKHLVNFIISISRRPASLHSSLFHLLLFLLMTFPGSPGFLVWVLFTDCLAHDSASPLECFLSPCPPLTCVCLPPLCHLQSFVAVVSHHTAVLPAPACSGWCLLASCTTGSSHRGWALLWHSCLPSASVCSTQICHVPLALHSIPKLMFSF